MNTILSVGKHNKTYGVTNHLHKNWEIVFCTGGYGTFNLENSSVDYQKGDLIVIAPNVAHSNTSPAGFRNIHITVDNIFFNTQDIIKLTDSTSKIFHNTMAQIYYFYNCDMSNREVILNNLGDLIANYIIGFSNTKQVVPIIEKLKNAIMKNFSDSEFNINYLFELEENYNTNYLKKLFKKEVSLSPQQFLIELRISYAKKLLANVKDNNMTITEISIDCGYLDPLYFSRVFKATTGTSPRNYCQRTTQ